MVGLRFISFAKNNYKLYYFEQMDKKKIQLIKFNLAVGEAKTGPYLAPILGQSQINIQTFCKDFNEMTSSISEGVVLPVRIHKYEDKSFNILYKVPTLNYIFEQIVLNRQNKYIDNFNVLTIYELVDMLNIIKSFLFQENRIINTDKYYMKVILAFFGTKNIKLLKKIK